MGRYDLSYRTEAGFELSVSERLISCSSSDHFHGERLDPARADLHGDRIQRSVPESSIPFALRDIGAVVFNMPNRRALRQAIGTEGSHRPSRRIVFRRCAHRLAIGPRCSAPLIASRTESRAPASTVAGEPTHRLEEVTPASLGPVPRASRMCSNAEIGTRRSRSLKPRRTSGAGSSSPCAVLPNRHSSGSLRVLVLAAAVSKQPYQHATHAAGQYLSFATRFGLTFSNDPAWLAPG